MPRSFSLSSSAPHDFFLCLDIDSYFDHEHDIERIAEDGFTKSIPLKDRDILVTIFFNGDPDSPKFTIESAENLTESEISEAQTVLKRILGTELPLEKLRAQAGNDEKLSGLLDQYYGFRRLSRANFFEDAVNRLIQTQISHKPTAKKMVYGVRNAYAHRFETKKGSLASWPRPIQLAGADPVALKQFGLSERKGEYIVGLAHEILSGNVDPLEMDLMEPKSFLEKVSKIRGVGPTTAQDLLQYRSNPESYFAPKIEKGQEMGYRRWICWSYGKDANGMSDAAFDALISAWKGAEAMALEYLYLDYMMREKREKAAKKAKK